MASKARGVAIERRFGTGHEPVFPQVQTHIASRVFMPDLSELGFHSFDGRGEKIKAMTRFRVALQLSPLVSARRALRVAANFADFFSATSSNATLSSDDRRDDQQGKRQ